MLFLTLILLLSIMFIAAIVIFANISENRSNERAYVVVDKHDFIHKNIPINIPTKFDNQYQPNNNNVAVNEPTRNFNVIQSNREFINQNIPMNEANKFNNQNEVQNELNHNNIPMNEPPKKINDIRSNNRENEPNNIANENIQKSRFMQVYIECGNSFIPPIRTIPSYRIQCTTRTSGYECCESKAYLDFIINTYDNPLADIYIFMHGHNAAWHFINPLTSTLEKLINSEYINEHFGGYQCYWNYGPTVKTNEQPTNDLMKLLFKNTNIETDNFGNWSYPCCSTFFVHSDQIRRRPKSEYIQMVENLREWSSKDMNYKRQFGNQYDGFCGRIYEMMWNRILSDVNYVKLPPYCRNGDSMKTNPVDNSIEVYKSIYK